MPTVEQSFQRALQALNSRNLVDADRLFRIVLNSQPQNVAALNLLTVTLMMAERFADAEAFIAAAVSLNQTSDVSFYNYGLISKHLSKFDQAFEQFTRALRLNDKIPETWNNRGTVLNNLQRYDEAVADFEQAILLKANYADAYFNRGNSLFRLKRYNEALEAYRRAQAINPNFAEAWAGCGEAFAKLRSYGDALQAVDHAYEIKPDLPGIEGLRLSLKMRCCDWSNFIEDSKHLVQSVREGKDCATPFGLTAIPATARDQYEHAKRWAEKLSSGLPTTRSEKKGAHDKIRVAYLSSDFNEHAVAHLIAGTFESHDRARFEVTALSIGSNDQSELRKRLERSFERFLDVAELSDSEVASRVAAEIDILVDLNGFTQNSRTEILALRPAPVQVNYLGYPGTMGADFIDYIIADPTIIPASHQQYYSEKIICLPNTYQANDRKRRISDRVFTRAECGLPEQGFVFCNFNNNYKILPTVFDSMMRILQEVKGSVLWLLEDNEIAARNLRKEAQARAINPDRLVFAPRMESDDHLARHRLANLFLDTKPYNAHTTASDALWAGLPVLTEIGETFAGRVAASLLKAAHLPELITETQADYESMAIDLARNPDKLASIRTKLNTDRMTVPLFDTAWHTRHLEAAYETIYRRYQAGLPPDHIHVGE